MEQVLVIGAAKSGIAAAKLLHRHGYKVTLTDMLNDSKYKEVCELLENGTLKDTDPAIIYMIMK